jgi:ABC-type Fe3+-hydroxamate transport system substrate-binding protein
MVHDEAPPTRPKRRDYLTYGSALAASVLAAGCLDGSGLGGDATTSLDETTSTTASTETASATTDGETTEVDAQDTYAASIEPVGERTFDAPPDTVVGGWGFVADVLMTLGEADTIAGMARPGFWYQGFYELLPGVSMRDTTEIPATVSKSYRIKEELLYELDPDLLATDPNRFIAWYRLDPSTVQRFQDEVAPFFGNESRSKRSPKWPNWPTGEDYSYYGIPEFVERYGQVFQKQKRARAMIDLYESTMADVADRVPPRSERPTVGVLSAFTNPENRGFFGVTKPVPALEKTHELKQYGDLGVVDAFEGQYPDSGGHYDIKADFEALLEVDPDVLVFKEAVNALGGQNVYGNAEAYEQTLEVLRTDEVGKQLSAVKDDRLYPGGTGSQGPIVNLFQTEMLAKQLYPDEFGPWRGLGETPEPEQLFDRQRLAAIVTGDV